MERKHPSLTSLSSSDLLLPHPSSNTKQFGGLNTRRRYIFLCLTFTSLITLVSFSLWTVHSSLRNDHPWSTGELVNLSHPSPVPDPLAPRQSLNGPPTAKFRDNLRPDLKYISSWISAGWTNDVMTYMNLVYLGLITDRIPVMPMFTPSHIGGHVRPIPFGDVFDVPRLRRLLGKPVLEWREVKDPQSDSIDELGCWNVWEAVQVHEAFPRDSAVTRHLNLDISYTKLPDSIKLIPNFEHDQHVSFWALAPYAYPEERNASLVTPLPSPRHNVSLPPDEQMLCFDYLYYTCALKPFEFDRDYSPAWRYAGQYFRWTTALQDLADQYVRQAIGSDDDEPIPPFIAIHIRHGDFSNWCFGYTDEECFAPLPVIARRVEEVKAELLEKKGVVVRHVLMTSDERNATWWQQVAELGWFMPDHSQTKEIYGDWYPVLIDAVIQSSGIGFVGTDRSTMSILAKRRVESWYDGVTRMVLWGEPHADDH